MKWSSIFLCLHIISGFTGLLSGMTALILRKGGSRQRVSVMIFYGGILVSIFSVTLFIMKKDNWGIILISGLTKFIVPYLIFHLFMLGRNFVLSIVSAIWLTVGVLYFNIPIRAIMIEILVIYLITQSFDHLQRCIQNNRKYFESRGLIFQNVLCDVIIICLSFFSLHDNEKSEIDIFFIIFPFLFLVFIFCSWLFRLKRGKIN